MSDETTAPRPPDGPADPDVPPPVVDGSVPEQRDDDPARDAVVAGPVGGHAPAPEAAATRLAAALDGLASRLAPLDLHLSGEARDEAVARRDRFVRTARDYLAPRLGDLDRPLVAVLVGSTGAGKSTLVNGLAQAEVTRPGVTRPTTRAPLVWCRADRVARYEDGFLTGYAAADTERPLTVVGSEDPLLEGLTVVDTPDVDSVEMAHHEVAADLLAVADVVVYVTSAQRYADAVPWTFLAEVRRRGTPAVFVVNRVPPGTDGGPDQGGPDEGGHVQGGVVADFRRMLVERGVAGDDPLVLGVDEQAVVAEHGGLPAGAVAPLHDRLAGLGAPEARRSAVLTALAGALASAIEDAEVVGEALAAERATVEQLDTAARRAYADQVDELTSSLRDGSLIRGEVLRRWQDLVGSDVLSVVSSGIGAVWNRTVGRLVGSDASRLVKGEATDQLAAAVTNRVQRASAEVVSAWELSPAGQQVLAQMRPSAYRPAEATVTRAEEAVADWTAQLARLVEEEGAGRKRVAQLASWGINTVAVSALLVTFGSTGGLTGAEAGIAGAAAAAQQGVLEQVLGRAAAQKLIARARSTLQASLVAVVEADAERYLRAAASSTASAGVLEEVTARVDDVRRLGRSAGLLDRRGRPSAAPEVLA